MRIGRITPAGAITEFPVPTPAYSFSVSGVATIAAGADGNLWFLELPGNSLAQSKLTESPLSRITPAGVMTESPLAVMEAGEGLSIGSITAGPNNTLWFTGGATGSGSSISMCTLPYC
jgi:virginiamycin B lyase